VDRADRHRAIRDQLRDPHALRAGVGKVELGRDALLEQVQVLAA
jgi:hypothetical protein